MMEKYRLIDWVSLLEELPQPIIQADVGGKIIYANKATQALLDYWGISVGELLPVQILTWLIKIKERQINSYTYTIENKTYEIVVRYIEKQQRINLYLKDITFTKKLEKTIEAIRANQTLKKLPSAEKFEAHLREMISETLQTKYLVGVFIIELDQFLELTTRFGHYVGEVLLNLVAERLTSFLPENSIITRLVGNEFAVAIPGLKGIFEAETIIEELRENMRIPYVAKGYRLAITTSVGVSVAPLHDKNPENLIKKARMAIKAIKQPREEHKGFYNQSLVEQFEFHEYMEKELVHAISKNQFKLFYEPRVCLKTKCVIGAEALLRWEHEQLGLVSPSLFIPIAEEQGLIHEIGLWVLESVFYQLKRWSEQGFPTIEVSVNLSPLQFIGNGLEETFDYFYKLDAKFLKFFSVEITESILIHDLNKITSTLEKLRSLGVQVFIDDFGTGYSSLSYLSRLPIDKLKIDQCFVRDLKSNPANQTILNAIIELAHQLKLIACVEGIENKWQLNYLTEHGCDEAQGYYFSPPLSLDEFEEKVLSYSVGE